MAWQAPTAFLALGDVYLYPPAQTAFEVGMGAVTKEKTVGALAAFIDRQAVPMRQKEDGGEAGP